MAHLTASLTANRVDWTAEQRHCESDASNSVARLTSRDEVIASESVATPVMTPPLAPARMPALPPASSRYPDAGVSALSHLMLLLRTAGRAAHARTTCCLGRSRAAYEVSKDAPCNGKPCLRSLVLVAVAGERKVAPLEDLCFGTF